jgi:hypothetical protein
MSALIPFLTLEQTCEQVQAWVNEKLTDAGFHVLQTFDLQVARLAHPDCPCPHHETDECNCQMVVLIVYRKQDDPATLVIHGQDGKTWLSLAGPTGQCTNQYLEAAIRHALMSRSSDVLSPSEVACET